jgi:hypothetical protein
LKGSADDSLSPIGCGPAPALCAELFLGLSMTDYARRLAALTAEPSRDDAEDQNRLARVERTRAEMMAQGASVAATIEGERAALDEIARRCACVRARSIASWSPAAATPGSSDLACAMRGRA